MARHRRGGANSRLGEQTRRRELVQHAETTAHLLGHAGPQAATHLSRTRWPNDSANWMSTTFSLARISLSAPASDSERIAYRSNRSPDATRVLRCPRY